MCRPDLCSGLVFLMAQEDELGYGHNDLALEEAVTHAIPQIKNPDRTEMRANTQERHMGFLKGPSLNQAAVCHPVLFCALFCGCFVPFCLDQYTFEMVLLNFVYQRKCTSRHLA
jgi:hypothetical protein